MSHADAYRDLQIPPTEAEVAELVSLTGEIARRLAFQWTHLKGKVSRLECELREAEQAAHNLADELAETAAHVAELEQQIRELS